MSLTRETIRSFMSYSSALRVDEFRSIEVVLDRLCSVSMPPFVAARRVTAEEDSIDGVPGIWYRPTRASDDAEQPTIEAEAMFHVLPILMPWASPSHDVLYRPAVFVSADD